MLLSVIIVSYNVKFFLEQCLCSLQAALKDINAEVLIVDNCSADDSIAYLQPYYPRFTFIQNSKNEGFAKANNKALRLAKGEYILFLNPDTILPEDALLQSMAFFKKQKDAGAVGVRMIDGSGNFLPESKRAFPSPTVSFYKLAGLSMLFPKSKVFNKYALGFLPDKQVHEVDVLAGAFMMVKKSVLDTTGGFDEQFFMYAEDIDLSYRIQQAGCKNYYLGNITIIHFKGESTKKGSLNYVQVFYEAMRLFVKKHYHGAGAWLMYKGLYAGILLRQMIAATALPFYRHLHKNSIDLHKIYVAGDALQSAIAEKIVTGNNLQAAIQLLNEDQAILANIKEDAVVLCTGSLTYKQAIQFVESNQKFALVMWFGCNSRSIVGSNNKNASGYVWH